MIENIITTFQTALAKKANTLQVQLAEEVGVMRADVTKVRQILFNLLSNACKFTDHGTISLDVDRSTVDGKDWIRFRCSDTGIGITAEQKEGLFQEFAQADVSIARKYGGTGLGLAITHRFVQLMKGHIGVESQPGEGSTFTVHLPTQVIIATAEATQAEGTSDVPAAFSEITSNLDTILVIDDDSAVRDLMSRFLIKLGFHVVTAASGVEGLRLARRVHPRIITLDVIMPGKNGWAVLSELKADSELADIPVIMITIVDNEVAGFDLGASNYLIKPIDRDRLALLLEKYRVTRPSNLMEANPPSASWTLDGQEGPAEIGAGIPRRS